MKYKKCDICGSIVLDIIKVYKKIDGKNKGHKKYCIACIFDKIRQNIHTRILMTNENKIKNKVTEID